MKASIAKTKAKNALTELKAAKNQLGGIRPSAAMEPEEFFELCQIKETVGELVDRLEAMMKGGLV